jgi:hypothetical protein
LVAKIRAEMELKFLEKDQKMREDFARKKEVVETVIS